MSVSFAGNYENSMFNPAKRYRMHFQKGVPLSSNELEEVQEVSDLYIRQLITNNFPSRLVPAAGGDFCFLGTSTNNGFKVVESETDTINNFTVKGGDGTVEGAGVLFVDGYILFLKDDIEYKNQNASGNLTDDAYTKTLIPAIPDFTPLPPPAPQTRTDEVYIDFYFAEVSATGVGVGAQPPEYKDTSIIVPGIGFATANRVRMVQDIRVAVGTVTPSNGTDSNGIYHRYVKLATIVRTTNSNILTSMITDHRVLVNSISSYSLGNTITDLVLSDGSNIGRPEGQFNSLGEELPECRISSIYMASNINHANDLTFSTGIPNVENIRFSTTGRIGVGTTSPQDGIHIYNKNLRMQNTTPEIDFYQGTTFVGDVKGVSTGIDIDAFSTGNIRLQINGISVPRLIVNSSGNVGIGTTNATFPFHVQGNSYVSGILEVGEDLEIGGDLNIGGASNFTSMNVSGKLSVTQTVNDNALVINKTNTGNAAAISISNSGTGPSLIVNNGSVGIGTASPSYLLHVQGECGVTDTLQINQSQNKTGINVNQTGNATAVNIHNTGTGSALLIDTGNVGIGTGTPAYKTSIYGDALQIGATGTTLGGTILLTSRDSPLSSSSIRNSSASLSQMTFSTGVDALTILNTGFVGINTATPQSRFHVQGDARVQDGVIRIVSSTPEIKFLYTDDTDTEIGSISADNTEGLTLSSTGASIRFFTNGTEKVKLESGGNFGIATSSPQYKLHVQGTGYVSSDFTVGNNSSVTGNLLVTGNVGIGTATPATKLDLRGNAGIFGTASFYSGAGNGYISANGTGGSEGLEIGTGTQNLRFVTDSGERIRVTSGGNVGIGTSNPLYKLHVEGQAYFNTIGGSGVKITGDNGYIDRVSSRGTMLVLSPIDEIVAGTMPAEIAIDSSNGDISLTTGSSSISVSSQNSNNNITLTSSRINLDGSISSSSNTISFGASTVNFNTPSTVNMYYGTASSISVASGATNIDSSGLSTNALSVSEGVSLSWSGGSVGIGTSYDSSFASLLVAPTSQNGIHFLTSDHVRISAGPTFDGSTSNAVLTLCGGRYPGQGAYIDLYGNQTLNNPGGMYLSATGSGEVVIGSNVVVSAEQFVTSSGTNYFRFYNDTANTYFEASRDTDDGAIHICHGEGYAGSPSASHGGFISVFGNAASGDVNISTGSGGQLTFSTDDDLFVYMNNHKLVLNAIDQIVIDTSPTDYFKYISQIGNTYFKSSRVSNDGAIYICHGEGSYGVPSAAYGGYVSVYGNGATGNVTVSAGTNAGQLKLESYDNLILNAHGYEWRFQNGGNTVAKINAAGQYFSDASTTITLGADLAEWNIVKDDISKYDIGTIVQQTETDDMTVEVANNAETVYGIITDRASFCGGLTVSEAERESVRQDFHSLSVEQIEAKYNAKRVAMTGHVLCKVVGVVKRGSKLVLSDISGVARMATKIELVNAFAIARQNYNSNDVGMIEVRLL